MDRSEFIKRGSVFGLSLTASALRSPPPARRRSRSRAPAPQRSAAGIRVGCIPPPAHGLDPHTLRRYRVARDGQHRRRDAEPDDRHGQARSRARDRAGSRTRTPRCGRTRCARASSSRTARTMTADDVVATFKRLVDPNSGSQALSAFKGVLSPGGVQKVDDLHGRVPSRRADRRLPVPDELDHLPGDHPAGRLPARDVREDAAGDGRVQAHRRTRRASARRTSATTAGGAGTAPLDGVDLTYFSDDAAVVSALLGNQIDLINEVHVSHGPGALQQPERARSITREGRHAPASADA